MSELCETSYSQKKISWSKLKNYETCHQRSKLMIEGKKSKAIDGRGFLPGNLADRCMRAYLEEGTFEHGGMEKFLEQFWGEHTGPDAEYTIGWRGNHREDKKNVILQVQDVLRILEPILLEKVAPYSYKPEYRFTSTLGIKDMNGQTVHVEVFGAVDVAVNYGDHYGLFDLKVSNQKVYLDSTLAQLTFYAIAFRGWTGVWPTEFAFWTPMMNPTVLSVDVTMDEIRYMQSRIISYFHGVWSENWELTQNKNDCFFCPTKHACPRFVNPITLDDQGQHRLSFEKAPTDVEVNDEL